MTTAVPGAPAVGRASKARRPRRSREHTYTGPVEGIGLSMLFRRPVDVRSLHLNVLVLLGLLLAADFARPILLPLVLSALLALLLSGPVRFLVEHARLPHWLAAALVLLSAAGVTAGTVAILARPAVQWGSQAPQQLRNFQRKIQGVLAPVAKVNRSVDQVQAAVTPNASEGTAVRRVALEDTSMRDRVWATARDAGIIVTLTGAIALFLLATGDGLLRKGVTVVPTLTAKKRVVRVARLIQQDVSRYLATIVLINLGLGAAIALALGLMGFPNPVLFGVIAALLNFVPYLGAAVGVVIVTVVGLGTFDSAGHAIAVTLTYLALTCIEGTFITPVILGRRFRLSPLAVFLSILFWGWLWGVPGALLAVPLLATAKIVCDNYEPLARVGVMLGRWAPSA